MTVSLLRAVGAIALVPSLVLAPSVARAAPVLAVIEHDADRPQDWSASIREPSVGLPLNPETFDLRTTTDTEVQRTRLVSILDVVNANLHRTLASNTLNQNNLEFRARVDQDRLANDTLDHIEDAIVDSTVTGFKAMTVKRSVAIPIPPVDNIAGEAMTSFVTDQLTRDRDEAADYTAETKQAVEDSRQSLYRAQARHLEASRALRAAQSRLMALDERIAEHQRLALKADQAAATQSSTVELGSVAGFLTVGRAIEADVDRLIADARRNGYELGGGGYRSEEAQVQLRIANCARPGELNEEPNPVVDTVAEADLYRYLVFEAPASSCTPPTAPPGESEHQAGLAIDLTEGGALLTAASPSFQWLTRNGQMYGLVSLPGEPWHWSATGR